MTNEPNKNAPQSGGEWFRQMSAHDLTQWGLNVIAYVKKVPVQGGEAFAIHAANGESLGLAADRDTAFATVRQNDLEPVSVH